MKEIIWYRRQTSLHPSLSLSLTLSLFLSLSLSLSLAYLFLLLLILCPSLSSSHSLSLYFSSTTFFKLSFILWLTMFIPWLCHLNETANILFDEMGDAKITGGSVRMCTYISFTHDFIHRSYSRLKNPYYLSARCLEFKPWGQRFFNFQNFRNDNF